MCKDILFLETAVIWQKKELKKNATKKFFSNDFYVNGRFRYNNLCFTYLIEQIDHYKRTDFQWQNTQNVF